MWFGPVCFRSLLDPSRGRQPWLPARRRGGRRLRRRPTRDRLPVEALEDRCLLSFSPVTSFPVGGSPQAAVTADFNNDGLLDLATANSADNTVSVLLGNGDGSFRPVVSSPTTTGSGAGLGPRSLAVGDFDGDGSDDVVTVNNSDVTILLGNGDGTPGNGDGTLRLAGTVSLPAVTVPGNDGDLTQTPLSVAVGDLTGDGLLDLAVSGLSSFTIKHGPYTYSGYWGSWEYYTYETHNNGHVNVLIGDGLGNFASPAAGAVHLLEGTYPISAALEELDGVAGLDLAVADYYGSRVRVLSGNDDGTFDAPVDYSTGWSPASVLTGDVNGDGIDDLVTANYFSASVLLGNGSAGVGDGTFRLDQDTYLSYYAKSVAVGDINADGKLDLVATSNYYCYNYPYESRVDVLLGYGDGTFDSPIAHFLAVGTFVSGVAVGDLNGDGLPDVAVTSSDADSGDVSVFINAGGWVLPAKLNIGDVTVTEGDGGTIAATFTVTRSGNLAGTATVNWSTSNGGALAGSDYIADSGTLTFADGELTKAVTILVKGDLTDEYDQGFFVNLSAASGAVITDGQGFGKILDDDLPPTVTITAKVSAKEGNNNRTTSLNFVVTLSAASEKEVLVNFTTANGTATTADNDYVATSGTLVFAPGQTTKTIPVVVKGDKKKEANETFFVNLTTATNATILNAQGLGEILDDDAPPGKR